MRRALATREKALGPDHPDVAQSLNNLAQSCLGQKATMQEPSRFSGALWQSMGKSPGGRTTRMWRPNLSNLALLLQAKGDDADAEPLYRLGLGNRRQSAGAGSPRCGDTPQQPGTALLEAKGDYAGAEPLYRRASGDLTRGRWAGLSDDADTEKELGRSSPEIRPSHRAQSKKLSRSEE